MEARVLINFGGVERVLTSEQAYEMMAIFQQGEAWESQYNSSSGGKPSYYTYKVTDTPLPSVELRFLAPGMYETAKLAGNKE